MESWMSNVCAEDICASGNKAGQLETGEDSFLWKPVAYWEGRIPPPEYFRPIDPYSLPNVPEIDHRALTAYAKQAGKAIAELSRDEVQQFIVKKPEGW